MIYELRMYHVKPGKMQDVHNRFSTLTLRLFKKYGMNTLDFWEDAEGKDIIYYVLEHKDMETRNQSFMNFKNDSEWIEGKRISELNGPLVEKVESIFMNRVPYSPANKEV